MHDYVFMAKINKLKIDNNDNNNNNNNNNNLDDSSRATLVVQGSTTLTP